MKINEKNDSFLIQWANVKDNAILPTKDIENGGYDLYICSDKKDYIIGPGEIELLPTGIASAFPNGFVGIIKERGSTGSKCMAIRMGVIDSGFRGEWFIGINNTSKKRIVITKDIKYWNARNEFYQANPMIVYPMNKAIAQVIFIQEPPLKSAESFISYEELKQIQSNRGTGALGSSDK